MPTALTVESYQTIVGYYNQAQTALVGIDTYYYNAAYEIVLLQTFDPTLDLLAPFYNAYLASQTIYSVSPQSTVAAVAALHFHILNQARTNPSYTTNTQFTNISASEGSRFTDINDWLDAGDTQGSLLGGAGNGTKKVGRQGDTGVNGQTSIKVPSRFASISAQAGYTIESANIS